MRWQPSKLFTPISPETFAPFDGLEGLCALARDEDYRLVWCNAAYARQLETTPDKLVGTLPGDVLSPELARDREARFAAVAREGRMASYYQFWCGVRWHTRVWPLDPSAFGRPGLFILMHKSVDPPEPSRDREQPVILSPVNDLGELSVLTRRELEVLYFLASGMTVNEIASELFRSPKTIGRHAENIHRKMGYASRSELVLDATRRGLVAFTSEEWANLVNPP
ncbi:MAG: LuxR C-terminal-related transcriptional regulator [Phycisphaerales bacterium]|nr:PAS domain-containing protein [Planctomycetota bacterium]MCH8509120.1 LuxR C-terminal-related transcriptional regulator [Phycisphaerales bacterium]